VITLASKDYDIAGHVVIRNPRIDQTLLRRTNRTPTMDGGAAVNDSGFSHADRTLRIRWKPESRAQLQTVERLISVHSRVIVSFEDGVFEAVISDYAPSNTDPSLTLLPLAKLSED